MLSTDLPRRIAVAFGNAAGAAFRRTIPVASQIGVVDGAASYTDGFPPLNAQPVASGGIPPDIKDMNGVLFDTSGWARALSAGQVFMRYDADFATAIGGYPAGAVLASTTPGVYYRCNANNNMVDPDGSPTAAGWAYFFPQSLGRATTPDVQAGTATGLYIDPVALRGAMPFSFGPTGYQVEPTGFTRQWGLDTTPRSAEVPVSITFPLTFPNACLGIRGTVRNISQSVTGCTQVQEVSISASGAVVFLQSDQNTYSDATGGFRWEAWGY